LTILIVDDNPAMRRAIRYFLGDLGEFHECSDGSEALDAYTTFHPDWVLMDIRMPVLDGLSATRQIMAADANARVLIVTDYDDKQLRSAATGAGACGYIVKSDLVTLRAILGSQPDQLTRGEAL